MSRIKGKNTKPELLLRSYLHNLGFRYRIHSSIVGKPDLVFPKRKVAVFVHGCFWHQHGCKNSVIPKSNIKFWEKKLNSNLNRDKYVKELLKRERWTVVVMWECEIKSNISSVVKRLITLKLRNRSTA